MKKIAIVKLVLAFTFLITLLLLGATPVPAQTTLIAGDIAIIGLNCDDPDQFAFVLLRDVEAGTQIRFTDNGWRNTNQFRTGEGFLLWTAGAAYGAGTVIQFSGVSGEFSISGSFSLSTSGDQILAYQGTEAAPVFIYALNDEGSAVWQADATDSNTSALPTGLTNGTTAVALNEDDSGVYNGTTTGTRAELLAAISNYTNWTMSGNSQTMPSGPFTVNPNAIELVSFTATPQHGAVLLEWETATELDNLGFNLYRANSPDGPCTRLNASLIPSQNPGSPIGASYSFLDEDVQPGLTYYYWLEDVDIYGVATLHGPVTATVPGQPYLVRPRPALVPWSPPPKD